MSIKLIICDMNFLYQTITHSITSSKYLYNDRVKAYVYHYLKIIACHFKCGVYDVLKIIHGNFVKAYIRFYMVQRIDQSVSQEL